jgi:hypothetical protein
MIRGSASQRAPTDPGGGNDPLWRERARGVLDVSPPAPPPLPDSARLLGRGHRPAQLPRTTVLPELGSCTRRARDP